MSLEDMTADLEEALGRLQQQVDLPAQGLPALEH